MRVIARKALVAFWSVHPDAEASLEAWYQEANVAIWKSSADIKAHYGSASVINNRRVVFNICGNKFRLVTDVNYHAKLVYIRFVGTHKAYDKLDVESI